MAGKQVDGDFAITQDCGAQQSDRAAADDCDPVVGPDARTVDGMHRNGDGFDERHRCGVDVAGNLDETFRRHQHLFGESTIHGDPVEGAHQVRAQMRLAGCTGDAPSATAKRPHRDHRPVLECAAELVSDGHRGWAAAQNVQIASADSR